MKKHIFKRILAGLLSLSMVIPAIPITAQAENTQAKATEEVVIEKISAKAASGHGAELAVDGKTDTYWQSIPSGGEGDAYKINYAHNRYIDITLDGMYDLSQIKIYNRQNSTYNNYYVYASTDGVNFDKIISKTSDSVATAAGDSYTVDVKASHLRLNMAYNSNEYVTNLSEIEIYGERTGDRQDDTSGIQVDDWAGSKWQKEWDKFETDTIYAENKVLAEMTNLVGRVIGEKWKDSFVFEMRGSLQDEKDIFELKDGKDGKIVIRGNNGIAMASGFNYYLKNYVYVDYNPLFGSNVSVDKIVPVGETVVKEAQYNLRYALNFCTYSYTMAFWNWDEYEEFLDWCAMNGLNLVLDIVGQEEVLRQTFLEYNFTEEEIKDYICGPAYFAWFYMQNLYSVGGPLPDAWFEQRAELGRQIHDRMQTYGITPVLQAFSGQVPDTFPQKNEGAQMAPADSWPGHTRPRLLMTYVSEGQTDYFAQVAETFYEKQANVFGDISDYYATDPFHEGGNVGSLDVATIYETVQKEMIESNSEAVWILQQWQDGLSDGVKISRLDTSHVLVLDLQSDMRQQNGPFEQRQIPWLYCMLHNFGGRMGLDGEIPVISSEPMETYQNKNHMVGIGITPEALENSPVAYELFLEVLWSKDPIDYNEWIDNYAKRRAGGDSESLQEAWDILVETAYADKGVYYQGAAETVINARPADSFKSASTWGHSGIYYDKAQLDEALRLLEENYEAFQNSEAFKYDLADVAEQVLCNAAVEYHSRMVTAKNQKNLEEFEKYSTKFLEIIELSDKVLSSTDEFMLGTWIEASRKMIIGADDWTKDLFEFNARSLVTTWGGERAANNGGLKDYSNRKWAGLTTDFYKERWEIWIRNRTAELKGVAKETADQKAESNWFLWEYQWTNRKSDDNNGEYAFATEPADVNLGELANQVYNNYSYTALVRNDGAGEEKVNAAKDKKVTLVTGSTQSGNLANVADGDTGTSWVGNGTADHVLEIDLAGTWSLSEFVLSIPQLAKNFPYYYKLETFDADTNAWTVVTEYTERQLGSNTTISTGKNYTADKIKITMNTSDATDSPLTITDLAAYGVALDVVEYVNLAKGLQANANVSTASDSSLSKLTDGDTTSLWKTPWPYNEGYPANVTLDLGEAKYVEYVEVYFESAGRPYQFEVLVEDEQGATQAVYDEYKSHTGTLPTASFRIPVQEKIEKVTVSFVGTTGKGSYGASTPAMTEIMVMGQQGEADAIENVRNRISEIRTAIASLNYNGYAGSYSTEKKAELEEVFTEVEDYLNYMPDAQRVAALLKQVNDAYEKFSKEGKVYINRSKLLAALTKAAEMLDGVKDSDLQTEKATVESAYQSAMQVYDTYRVTQSQVDNAAQALEEKVNTYYETFLNYKFANKIVEAKETLNKKLVYTAESLAALGAVIAETETAQGKEAKETAYGKLQTAMKRLEKILCVDISWKSGLGSKGVIAGNGKYAVEDKVVFSAKDVKGYKFAGWYIGEKQISQEHTYEYVVKATDINTSIRFVAKYELSAEISWKSEPITNGVTVGAGYYNAGEKVELLAKEVEGAKFSGWYVGEELISSTLSCTYTVKETDMNVELVAKYEILTLTGVTDNELYVGETAGLIAAKDVTVEVSKVGVVNVDKETMTIAAVGAGIVELTFKKGSEVIGTETVTVLGGDLTQLSKAEWSKLNMSVTANTEEAGGEGAVNGYISAVIDGDSGSFWHTAWSTGSFTVSESNPAIITLDLGAEMSIPGFMFQQRQDSNNGAIQMYSYEAMNAAGEVVASGTKISVPAQQQATGAVVLVGFNANAKVKTIMLSVLQGKGGFGCMGEMAPITQKAVAVNGQVTLADTTMTQGERITLVPECAENTFVKGLVWTSSDENVATVNQSGVVTAIKTGTVKITAKNAAGVAATCIVTITGATEEHEHIYNTTVTQKATCTQEGLQKKTCTICGDTIEEKIPTQEHVKGEWIIITQPTASKEGKKERHCVNCKKVLETAVLSKLKEYTITYKLNGGKNHSKNPGAYGADKAVTLQNPSRKGYKFKGWYTDSKYKKKITTIKKGSEKNYTLYAKWEKVTVKKVSLKSVKNAKGKKAQVLIKKLNGVTGYEVAYSTSKKFVKKSTKTNTSKKTVVTLKNLKKSKKYFVKVRAYTLDSTGKKVYGKYSAVKTVTIKK